LIQQGGYKKTDMKQNIKITRISIFKALIPLKESFKIALGVIKEVEAFFIKIETSAGIYGMGEVAHYHAVTGETQGTCEAAAIDLGKLLIGNNPLDISGNINCMNQYLRFNSAVKAGFDMALYDIAGKVASLPLYALLGGSNRALITDQTIGIDTPKNMAAKALTFKKNGFTAIKVKLGESLDIDVARIQKIRESIGPDIQIRVDANQGWDYPTAITALKRMEPYNLEYCEQPLPVWDHENMKRLRQSNITPIAADESVFDDKDAFKLAANGCCDILNIKLSKSGGINTAVRIDNIAVSAGFPCMLGCMNETRLGLTAAAHIASAHPNIKYLDLDGHTFLSVDPVDNGMVCDGESIIVPDIPGLGADINREFLEKCKSVILD